MDRHTFVKKVKCTKNLFGLVTGVSASSEPVNIPTNSEIKRVAAESVEQLVHDISLRDRKLAKVAKQAATAAKNAAEAKEEVKRLVEAARETFREVIEEMLAPHYRLLAQLLGGELPTEKMKQKIDTVKPCSTVVVKNKKDDAKSKSTSKTRKSIVRKKTAMASKGRMVAAKRNKAKKRPTPSSKAK